MPSCRNYVLTALRPSRVKRAERWFAVMVFALVKPRWMSVRCWPIGDASEIEGQPPPHDRGLPEILLRIDASIREDTEKHAADGRRECLTLYAGHSTYSKEGVADTSGPVPSMPLRNV